MEGVPWCQTNRDIRVGQCPPTLATIHRAFAVAPIALGRTRTGASNRLARWAPRLHWLAGAMHRCRSRSPSLPPNEPAHLRGEPQNLQLRETVTARSVRCNGWFGAVPFVVLLGSPA